MPGNCSCQSTSAEKFCAKITKNRLQDILADIKTYERIALLRYYWPSLHRDWVTRYVKAYQICQQCKVQTASAGRLDGKTSVYKTMERRRGRRYGAIPSNSPRQRIHSRFCGRIHAMGRSHSDLQGQRPDDPARLNERIFLRFGVPDIFHSDNGTEFKNKIVDKFLKERGVKHTTIAPYADHQNPTKRVNRTFKTRINRVYRERHNTWDVTPARAHLRV
ncbi:unnamed protein product [Trichogramma brassicae]|uniref:Integrase catalytic domain-containing protein n=1 Tax=Trichogramma brassicae TaxID=86971 RepID=A0A6H5J2D7_9HYME|nr:unnamed protein product [Trichogramma brassicae]